MKFISALIFAFTFTNVAEANEIVAVCEQAAGHSYYVEDGNIVKHGQGEWQESAITQGKWLLMNNNGTWDIIFSDATGVTTSTVSSGGQVVVTHNGVDEVVVVSNYGVVIETFGFYRNNNNPIMLMTQIKTNQLISVGSLYKADCSQFK